jgi:hypothetical protein
MDTARPDGSASQFLRQVFRPRMPSVEVAETLALTVLSYLLEDPDRASRFCAATGLGGDELARYVGDSAFLCSTLSSMTSACSSKLRRPPRPRQRRSTLLGSGFPEHRLANDSVIRRVARPILQKSKETRETAIALPPRIGRHRLVSTAAPHSHVPLWPIAQPGGYL